MILIALSVFRLHDMREHSHGAHVLGEIATGSCGCYEH